jgi:hypothetical protein
MSSKGAVNGDSSWPESIDRADCAMSSKQAVEGDSSSPESIDRGDRDEARA